MISTGEGPLWLSAIRDAFARMGGVAWGTSARADADLVLTTLEYALASREVEPGQRIHHADHGCQYTSIKLTTRLLCTGVQALMDSDDKPAFHRPPPSPGRIPAKAMTDAPPPPLPPTPRGAGALPPHTPSWSSSGN
ncbi:hypothetical protein [Actinacidiphila sp. bgisy144]|uniref:hypothetical protein n=1 Tax=Actinacidiphila sp. bgisy144 TaxID=3413791 RepID=UPI003EBA8C76